MSWDRLPLEIYVHIFKHLNFWDRKPLSLVCRRWNEAVFSRSLCRNLCIELSRGDWGHQQDTNNSNNGRASAVEQVTLVEDGVVEASQRDYRTVYVKWCRDSTPDVLASIARKLAELDEKCQLEGLIVDAPVGALLTAFFRTHGDLLARVRKLQVCTDLLDSRLRTDDQCLVSMDRLETLVWREVVTSDQVQIRRPLFVLNTPNLQSAMVRFGDSDSDRGILWHNSLMEIERSGRLKVLKMHLNSRMWEQFFEQRLQYLEHLTLLHHSQNMATRDWDAMFTNLPNLRIIQMWKVNDTILEAINRHCPHLKILLLDDIDLTGQFLSTDRVFPNLEHLRLNTGKIHSNRTLLLPSLNHLQWVNMKNQDGLVLNVFAPNLRVLRQAKYSQPDFVLSSCLPLLQNLQLDLYASDIPDHFHQQFPAMDQLSVRISSARPDLDRVVAHFRNVTEFTLITYNSPLQCDALLGQMFKHCDRITSLTLCGFNPNLELSFPVFAQIFRNRLLKSLKLFGLTISGNSFPVQLPPELVKFELRYVKVMDVAFGAYVFPPDGPFQVICNRNEDCCCYFSKDCD